MEISELTAWLTSLIPTASAVLGMVVMLIKTIRAVKRAHRETIDECAKQNAALLDKVCQIAQKNDDLTRENEELKRDLRKVMSKLNRVHIEDK